MKNICVKCSAPLKENAKFCSVCGTVVKTAEVTQNQNIENSKDPKKADLYTSEKCSCGAFIKKNAKFCTSCGATIIVKPPPVEEAKENVEQAPASTIEEPVEITDNQNIPKGNIKEEESPEVVENEVKDAAPKEVEKEEPAPKEVEAKEADITEPNKEKTEQIIEMSEKSDEGQTKEPKLESSHKVADSETVKVEAENIKAPPTVKQKQTTIAKEPNKTKSTANVKPPKTKQPKDKKPVKKSVVLFIILGAFIFIIGASIGGYFLYDHLNNRPIIAEGEKADESKEVKDEDTSEIFGDDYDENGDDELADDESEDDITIDRQQIQREDIAATSIQRPEADRPSESSQGIKSVRIGNQTWMAENLNINTGNNWIPEETVWNDNTRSYEVKKYPQFGRLYDWNTARNACPAGWRLPTDDDWKQLELYLGMPSSSVNDIGWRGTNQGGRLKSTGSWESPNTGAINNTGFSALPAGNRYASGSYYDVRKIGFWWTATDDGNQAWYRSLSHSMNTINRNKFDKTGAFSVRCIKN